MTKPFRISKESVWQAYLKVKSNGGNAGVDGVSLEEFEGNLKNNLYKIWNRLASGSYFPPPVKGVYIPKKSGGMRLLGVPCISDRIAQTVIKQQVEPTLEQIFDQDSYGYRPKKSALDAVAITRKRCWRHDWVVEFDIVGLFDNISHDLVLKALRHHCDIDWILLYVQRWLEAPISVNGNEIERNQGTPQGGVVSPVLANLFLHYAFDAWMRRENPNIPFCRYADDGLAHCNSREEAESLLQSIADRFEACGLKIHPKKSKIIYCKDSNRGEEYDNICFDFLGYRFQPRRCATASVKPHPNFLPAVSGGSRKSMHRVIRKWHIQLKSDKTLDDLSRMFNPILRGWFQYYGKFYPSELQRIWKNLNDYLVRWVRRKYKRFARHKTHARVYLNKIARANPNLFVHWKLDFFPAGLSNGSRMS